MSRDDAPNFRHIPAFFTCCYCDYLYDFDYCSKHSFSLDDVDGSIAEFKTCDDWKVQE